MKKILTALLFALSILFAQCTPCPALTVKATAYSFREPAHAPYGHLNCMGGVLDDTQIAADTRYYPLGTILEIDGLGRRIVTDRGSAIIGRYHIDVHFSNLTAMRRWGTREVNIHVVKTRKENVDFLTRRAFASL